MGREARGGPEEDDIHRTSVRKVKLTSDLLLFLCCITIFMYTYRVVKAQKMHGYTAGNIPGIS